MRFNHQHAFMCTTLCTPRRINAISWMHIKWPGDPACPLRVTDSLETKKYQAGYEHSLTEQRGGVQQGVARRIHHQRRQGARCIRLKRQPPTWSFSQRVPALCVGTMPRVIACSQADKQTGMATPWLQKRAFRKTAAYTAKPTPNGLKTLWTCRKNHASEEVRRLHGPPRKWLLCIRQITANNSHLALTPGRMTAELGQRRHPRVARSMPQSLRNIFGETKATPPAQPSRVKERSGSVQTFGPPAEGTQPTTMLPPGSAAGLALRRITQIGWPRNSMSPPPPPPPPPHLFHARIITTILPAILGQGRLATCTSSRRHPERAAPGWSARRAQYRLRRG